ncbi:SGNH/GDSL hydrolase family protein [Svornostia abyssi]|uniref:SGNH/GDSL hydrolase family protein n=1 Tax=Svornostia abyssi TaxID=2898438 RepID=A0ABY5PBB5_9ACTN|nr:SGNH/GDSL hydrolase family protein [Parviterribacteraceae bacterium J379]
MGDSLTAGIDETPPGTRWADLFAERLRESHGDLVYDNLAVFGMKSDEVRGSQLDDALRGPVDVASLICGGNDVMKLTAPDAEMFGSEMDAMFSALRAANPDALLIGGRIADMSQLLPYRERSRARVVRATTEFNAVIDDVAAQHDVRLVDFSIVTKALAGDFLASDGFHPSIAGQRAIYDAVVAALSDEPLLTVST